MQDIYKSMGGGILYKGHFLYLVRISGNKAERKNDETDIKREKRVCVKKEVKGFEISVRV